MAGDLLVSAFQQLGPAIRDALTQLLPGANNGLDGFANTIKTVVLPAIADFIRNIPSMIEAIKQFFLSATASALSFASSFLAALSGVLALKTIRQTGLLRGKGGQTRVLLRKKGLQPT